MEQLASDLPLSTSVAGGSGKVAPWFAKESGGTIILDLLPALILAPIYLVLGTPSLDYYSFDFLRAAVILGPFIPPIWLQLRMVPRIRRLANSEFRRDLALTFIQADSVLRAWLKKPLVRNAVVLIIVELSQSFMVWRMGINHSEFVTIIGIASGVLACTALSLWLTFGVVVRACRRGTDSTQLLLNALVNMGMVILVPLALIAVTILSHDNGGTAIFVSVVLICVFGPLALSEWKKLCRVYLQMDG